MHNLFKAVFLVIAALIAQHSLADDTPVPACFAVATAGGAACRVEAAIAPIENKYFVWGGKQTLGCATCDRRHQGLNSGGLYDRSGRLLEALPTARGPGARFDAQALWNRQALFIWGGLHRLDERRLADGAYETRASDVPSVNSYYLPGSRRWIRMAVTDSPPLIASVETRADGDRWRIEPSRLELAANGLVRACWTETPFGAGPQATYCRGYDMPANAWGAKLSP